MDTIPFSQLSRTQKRDTILAERAATAEPSRQVEITMAPASVNALVFAVHFVEEREFEKEYSKAASLSIISENWGADFDPSELSSGPIDSRLLALVAILSECTAGQGELIKELLDTAVVFRNSEPRNWGRTLTLEDADVEKVITDLLDEDMRREGEEEEEGGDGFHRRTGSH